MSEQDTTTQPKRTEAGPAGALEAALKAASQSLGTLCGGKIEFGETAVAPGSAEAWPANLAAPLMVTRIDVTGEVSGGTFVITQAADAHAMRAFMLGEEPPAETSAELNADELDAYGELCNNVASAVGSALRDSLECQASAAATPSHGAEDAAGVLAEIGDDCLAASIAATVAERETAIMLAFDAELRRAVENILKGRAGKKPAAPVSTANLSESVKRILKLPVPIIVVLAEKQITFESAINLSEGSVIEFNKSNAESLDLLVNNRTIGRGRAIKVGENFGLRVDDIGSPQNIVETLR